MVSDFREWVRGTVRGSAKILRGPEDSIVVWFPQDFGRTRFGLDISTPLHILVKCCLQNTDGEKVISEDKTEFKFLPSDGLKESSDKIIEWFESKLN